MVEQRQYETDDFEAQERTYDLTGTLTDPDGNPISDTDLSVKSEDGDEYSVTTDSDGKFIVESLPAGKYSVILESDDYGQLTEDHTIGDDDDDEEDDDNDDDDDDTDDSVRAKNDDDPDTSDDDQAEAANSKEVDDGRSPHSDEPNEPGNANAPADDATDNDTG